MTLTRWSPVRDLAAVEVDLLHRMFGETLGDTMPRSAWLPAVDIYETAEQEVVVKIDLPDMKREDIKVTFENSVLSIEGQRQYDGTDNGNRRFWRIERGHGAFRRSFTLPSTVDPSKVEASFQDGVLTITLPRREETRPRQIQIG
jgi:HSP20 family protein